MNEQDSRTPAQDGILHIVEHILGLGEHANLLTKFKSCPFINSKVLTPLLYNKIDR